MAGDGAGTNAAPHRADQSPADHPENDGSRPALGSSPSAVVLNGDHEEPGSGEADDRDPGVSAIGATDDRDSGQAVNHPPAVSASGEREPLRPVRLRLSWPGAALATAPAPSAAAMLLLLAALGSLTFDGLSRTFAWLGAIGANPLEYPGRTALVPINTAGLLGTVLLLSGLYVAAVAIGWRIAGRPGPFSAAAGRLALSLLPIAIAFHAAHYLPALLVDGQYVALALNDPFGRGADLFGLAGRHVSGSLLASPSGAARIYAIQSGLIIAGHAAAVWIAHAIAANLTAHAAATRHRPTALEAPLALLMIAYTAIGLWLLSSPSIG